jgi:tRNA(adenine34) deaminase
MGINDFMREALRLADQAEQLGEVPVGAVVVKDNQIIGRGYNQPISSHDPTAHAEIVALRDAAKNIGNYRLVDCDLYVTIEPCAMCAGAIVHSRIAKVCFGATEPKAGAVISTQQFFSAPQLNHKVQHESGILEQECRGKISAFFEKKRLKKEQAG